MNNQKNKILFLFFVENKTRNRFLMILRITIKNQITEFIIIILLKNKTKPERLKLFYLIAFNKQISKYPYTIIS